MRLMIRAWMICRPKSWPRGASAAVVGVAILATTGCGDPLKRPELIEETRVIGARAGVVGDEAEARPDPGQSVRVTWLVAYPGEPAPLSWAMWACPAIPVSYGTPQCADVPLVLEERDEPVTAPVELVFDVPDADSTSYDEIAVSGVMCTRGAPRLGDSLAASGCDDPAAAVHRVTFPVTIARNGDHNRNPSLDQAVHSLDADPWPAPAGGTGVAGDCANAPDLPVVEPGSHHVLRLEIDDSEREALHSDQAFSPSREELQISHFATDGALARPYSGIAADEPNRVEVGWVAPEEVGTGGTIVRFYFVARDLRGGVGWTVRAVCVAP